MHLNGRNWVLLIALGAGLGAAAWVYVNAPSIAGSAFHRPRRGIGGTAGGWENYQAYPTEQLEDLVRREPHNGLALAHLSRQLNRAGRTDEARAHAAEAISVLEEVAQLAQAQNTGTDIALGISLEVLGNLDEAILCYRRAAAQQRIICEQHENPQAIENRHGQGGRGRASDPRTDWYNLACYESLARNADAAFAALEKSISLGWFDIEHIERDEDFDPLRHDPRYREILGALARPAADDAQPLLPPTITGG
ncbi:MAG: hypothetical protein IT439_06765 [Phycisphaerales bacterium]|nr:hypothetical protein [Phycisphaerales bacterium]